MKKTLFVLFTFFFITNLSFSQNEIGLKFGLSSYDFSTNQNITTSKIKLAIDNASYGFQAGIYARIGLFGFYLQPELDFNSNTINYRIKNLNNLDSLNQIRTSSYKNIDVPVLFMITPSIFKIYAGPVGHYLINDVSDFLKKDKIKEMAKNLKYGYQLGLGVSINSLTLDVRYEGNFYKNIKSFEIDGKEYYLDDSKSRFIFSIWFRL